jgi:hypothetical protein
MSFPRGCTAAGVLSFGACIYVRASFVYCLMFIFTEVSTPFVNLRWMLHECDLADSKAYMATGGESFHPHFR